VAREIRRARADLIGAAMAQGGKTILESDPEVSEAVDFVEFYRDTARWWRELPALRARPKGVVVVVPPWNFPIAIPCGGVAAALAAGNTVILKPASDAVLVAWELCRCFWRARVSKAALQFVPGPGSGVGRRLVSHDCVDAVILTGGTATALAMLREKPEMNLCAETGGKNATIVTALSDRDQAIKHVLHSAFSHAGQKCSATSLLLLEAEVYDDPNFKRALCDAVESLPVGSAWDLENTMGPLIRPPSGDLENALKVLEPGEEWAVIPRNLAGNPHLWSPGVKWGVQPGSYTHTTEFFGPVLGVMRFGKLPEAVEYVNQTGYGLTSGLESLDDREQSFWREHIEAGNLYINRPTTGAVVLRQPFGGFGKSSVGPGIKVGSPNYVTQFMDFEDRDEAGERPAETVANPNVAELMDRLLGAEEAAVEPKEGLSFGEWVERLAQAVASQERSLEEEFGRTHDHFLLIGQDNLRRYRVISPIHVRLHPDDGPFELFARVCAARIAGCCVALSVSPGVHPEWVKLLERVTEFWAGWIEVVEETDEELAESIRAGRIGRVRYAAPDRVSAVVRRAASGTGSWIACAPVLREGRLELLNYIREQSVSADYHRYGNLGDRLLEERTEPL
jgi:RHH-type proline utilization regulon transcriptional repressor/proline dehydrogenase/delta 1-pyrroline-5-carboxylate dehydrogenase